MPSGWVRGGTWLCAMAQSIQRLGLLGILLCVAGARDLSYNCGGLLWLLWESV